VAPPQAEVDPQPRSTSPTLAVVVAVHNMAAQLGTALRSVFDQTVPAHEVVVCDDGSTDDIDAALAPYRDRVTLLRIPHGGEGAAKNAAVGATSSDFVVILDADDEMDPRRLEAFAWLGRARPDLDIMVTEVEQFGPEAPNPPWRLAPTFPATDQRREILRWNFLPAPALRRRALLDAGGFDEDLAYGPDWACHIRMVLRGSSAGLVLAPLYRYHRWPGQQTADQERVLHGRIAVLEQVAARVALADEERAAVARSLAVARLDRWRWELHRGRPNRSEARWLVRAATLGPKSRLLAAAGSLAPNVARAVDRGNRPR
jgi:glycosyltransferase involved in cell wall biosynthesis